MSSWKVSIDTCSRWCVHHSSASPAATVVIAEEQWGPLCLKGMSSWKASMTPALAGLLQPWNGPVGLLLLPLLSIPFVVWKESTAVDVLMAADLVLEVVPSTKAASSSLCGKQGNVSLRLYPAYKFLTSQVVARQPKTFRQVLRLTLSRTKLLPRSSYLSFFCGYVNGLGKQWTCI